MQDSKVPSTEQQDDAATYEAPCIESVVAAEDVEREAHYGGGISMG